MSTTANAAGASPPQRGFRRLWRVLRQLFHEVVGAVFAILAVGWLNAAFRAWTRDASRWLVALAVSDWCRGVCGIIASPLPISGINRPLISWSHPDRRQRRLLHRRVRRRQIVSTHSRRLRRISLSGRIVLSQNLPAEPTNGDQ